MAGEQRKCARCRFFKDAGIAGNGWCTHPKRQLTTDAMLLVRAGELACRNDWGGDLFQSRDDTPQADDSMRDLPNQSDLPAAHRDDEVTSVVTRPERPAGDTTEEDRVVSDRPAPHRQDDDDDSWNDAAHREQEERARIIARGSRDALKQARERHSSRHTQRQDDEDDSIVAAEQNRVITHQERFTDRRRSRFSGPTWGSDPVPRAEIEGRQGSPSDRFETIPDIDPNFDLPGSHDHHSEPTPSPEASVETRETAPEPGMDDSGAPPTTYESVLQRARRTREQRTQKHRPIRRSRSQSVEPDVAPIEPGDAASDDQIIVEAERAPDHPFANPALPDLDSEDNAAGEHATREPAVSAEASPVEPYEDPELEDDGVYGDAPHQAWHEPEQDAWYEEEVAPAPAERRRGGFLARLGLGRRQPESWYDEGGITRHAVDTSSARTDVDHDAPLDRYPDAFIAESAWAGDPEPGREESPYAEESLAWDGQSDDGDDVAYNNMKYYRHEFAEEELAPIPGPVPSARPSQEPMHRQRMARELPDLDDNLFEERFERAPGQQRPPLAFERERAAAPAREPATAREPSASPRSGGLFPASPRESYFRAARFSDWDASGAPAPTAHAGDEGDGRLPDMAEHDFDVRELVARGGELMDMTIDIAPDIPRECRTCRSFRSADGGARGWCTNEWAFTHRRMVNEDDLACDSTIGCWWLPADRYWLIEEQDGYAATPRMDELIARQYHWDPLPEREGASG